MKRRPVILIALIVTLPIAALAWAAWQIAENEQVVVQQRYRTLMEDRLRDINVTVDDYFEDVQRDIQKLLEVDTFEPQALRRISRTEPRLLQTFVLSSEGQLIYPSPVEELNSNEREFLIQASRMFTGQDLKAEILRLENLSNNAVDASKPTRGKKVAEELSAVSPDDAEQQQAMSSVYLSGPAKELGQFQQSSGWFLWYWDRGLNLILWQRRPSGHIVGGALVRARWMSDLVARLPETIDAPGKAERSRNRLPTRVQLVNASATTVYQWGSYEPSADQQALCEVPLPEPLSSWRLQCFVPTEELTSGTGRSVYFGLFSSLVAIAVVVAATTFLFLRDYSRDMREAQQQVSFVNQVSHELKTPLTNIRMYAELLESDLNEVEESEAERPRQRLEIILSEGQRLTRLISNVLTFARQQRDSLQLHLTEVCPDQAIQQIVDRFRPALAGQQVEVTMHLNSPLAQKLDCDFLEQILGNLISNVEKYAATGGQLCIESRQLPNRLILDIKDCGPGIEASMAEHVFKPFARVTNDVSYAAGTGIGLSIARELARLHGGDLVLQPSPTGCWFQAVLNCEGPS